jgi:hypothetical protein
MTGQWFPGTFWNTPLDDPATGRMRTIVNDANGYAAKLAAQATRTKTSTPISGFYPLGWQTISVDYSSSVQIVHVPDACRRVPVQLNQGTTVYQDTDLNGLPAICKSVPVPPNYVTAANSNDRPYVVVTESGECFEFWLWNAHGSLDGPFSASFGGYVPNIYNHPGAFPNGWGVSASGLPLIAGMLRMSEFQDYLRNGTVPPHMLRIQVSDTTGTHLAPAVRNDGQAEIHNVQGSNAQAVPEGAIFALPADYQPPTTLTAFETCTQLMARDYGMIVCDATGGTVNIVLEDHHTQGSGYCEIPLDQVTYPQPGFWDPYNAAASGTSNPWNVFPWTQLQQVAPPVP